MENSFQTSFIPKKPIIVDSKINVPGKKTTSIYIVISVILFAIMAISAIGLYLYKSYLQESKKTLSTSLFKMRDSFDDNTIATLDLYNKKASAAQKILDEHIVLSPLFELINDITIPSIQYTKFEHNKVDNNFSVRMSGVARDYKSIALQADAFNTSKGSMFKDVIFSNLTKTKNNDVTFNVEFSVDPSLLSYKNNVNLNKDTSNVITNSDTLQGVNTNQ